MAAHGRPGPRPQEKAGKSARAVLQAQDSWRHPHKGESFYLANLTSLSHACYGDVLVPMPGQRGLCKQPLPCKLLPRLRSTPSILPRLLPTAATAGSTTNPRYIIPPPSKGSWRCLQNLAPHQPPRAQSAQQPRSVRQQLSQHREQQRSRSVRQPNL